MKRQGLPPRIYRLVGAGFADFTVVSRFAKIVQDVERTWRGDRDRLAACRDVQRAIADGGAIDHRVFAAPTPFWRAFVADLAGKSWLDVPFLETEFLFYHALNSLSSFYDGGQDVFADLRRAALEDALHRAHPRLVDGATELRGRLETLLGLALYGNEFDYSQIRSERREAPKVLVDESARLIESLMSHRLSRVDIVADNAGWELVCDLLLTEVLLQDCADVVVMHLKPWPMFVSDALTSDAEQSIAQMAQQPASSGLRDAGVRLMELLAKGRLRLSTAPCWGEPRDFTALAPPVLAALSTADLVMTKGDLNYRRLISDRWWPSETRVETASSSLPLSVFALRVLKSDAVVGVPLQASEGLPADWRVSGRFAMVQRLGSGCTPPVEGNGCQSG